MDIFSGALRRDYLSELIKSSDQGRGWLDFMKASEVRNQVIYGSLFKKLYYQVGNNFIVELNVTLSFEEVLEEQACGLTSAAGRGSRKTRMGAKVLGI